MEQQKQAGYTVASQGQPASIPIQKKTVSIQDKMELKRRLKKQIKDGGEKEECSIFWKVEVNMFDNLYVLNLMKAT